MQFVLDPLSPSGLSTKVQTTVVTGGGSSSSASSGGGTWGSITGTLSDQTDLQTALDDKANDADVVHDTGNETVAGVKTFSSDPLIPDEAYGSGWNGVLEPTTKNAVYDQIETIRPEIVSLEVVPFATALTTGDGKFYFRIPSKLNGLNLTACAAAVGTASSSGTPTIQIARGRQSNATSAHSFADMLSTRITIDASEYDSKDATAAAAIDSANDDVATGDLIRVDVDVAGTNTTGLYVTLAFS